MSFLTRAIGTTVSIVSNTLRVKTESGARFSKVPVTFRARNQIFRSKYKE